MKRSGTATLLLLSSYFSPELYITLIGVDLAEILGDAWPAPKVGWCRVGGVWGGVSIPGVWGSVVRSPSGVRGRAPAENGFWRILKATERSFCTYMTKSEGDNLH